MHRLNMKRLASKMAAVGLSVAMACGIGMAIAGMQMLAPSDMGVLGQAQAKNMKERGLSFNLKNGKSFTSYEWYGGIGKKKHTVKMSKYKVKELSSGDRKITFTLTWTRKWAPTKSEVKKNGNHEVL